jgi:hypothetical protein
MLVELPQNGQLRQIKRLSQLRAIYLLSTPQMQELALEQTEQFSQPRAVRQLDYSGLRLLLVADANNYSNLRGGTVAESNPNYISPGNAGHSASSAVNDYALMIFNYTDTVNTKPFFMVGIAKMASQIEPLGVSALGATNVASAIDSFQLSNDSGGNFTAGSVKIYGVN